jgi:multisubunit Na+/H+ antiporter MnhB subunit
MTTQMAGSNARPRRLWRSIGALAAGFLVVFVLSTVTDVVMHATGIFPPWFQPMDASLWMLAIAYRVIYTVFGGYVAARLAPDRPMRHALILGFIGLAVALAGALATMGRGPEFGPSWFAFGLVLTALPSCWLGGVLHRYMHPGRQAASA